MALRPTDPALLHYRSGRVLRRPGAAGAGLDAGPRRAAGADGAGRRADRRRPAQGVRSPRPGDHPADLDHRLAPAAGGRAGPRPAPRVPAGRGLRVAGGRGRGLLLRRRLGQPLHRHRRDQHRAERRLPRAAGAGPVRLRGQRLGHLGADPARLGRGGVRSRPGLGYVAADGADPVAAAAAITEAVRTGYASTAGRSSCTCRPCASSVTPAATPRSRTGGRGTIEADYDRDPLLAHRPAAGRARASSRPSCWPATTPIRAEVDAEADRLTGAPRLRLGGRGDGPARAAGGPAAGSRESGAERLLDGPLQRAGAA